MLPAIVMLLCALGVQTPEAAPVPSLENNETPVVPPVPKLAAHRAKHRASAITVDAVVSAIFSQPLTLKKSGPEILRIEILLARAKFSSGELDGVFGSNLAHAVVAYRRSRKLSLEPAVDQIVWLLLNADTAPLFVDYTITKKDLRGPFEPVPHDMMGKSHLKRLGYESPAEMLGERFHINPKVLAELNPGCPLDQVGSVLRVPNVLTPPPAAPASLCINATDLTLQGLDASGEILMSYPVSVGSTHDPLPVGQLQILAVHPNPVYSYDSIHFWDSKGARSKARVAPGPNNPVGVVWIGLSKNHYGIHGTPSPHLIGRGQSHGCIRMTNWDATELSHLVAPDLNVVLKAE